MSEYQMKKALRRIAGTSKVYVQLEGQEQRNIEISQKPKKQFKGQKESVFDQKKWSVKERVKLLVFLSYYRRLQDWQSQRKSVPLYKSMSTFMKNNRTPEQCKNIHSLLKRKCHTMENILEYLQDLLQCEQSYEKLLSKYLREIEFFEKQNKVSQNPQDFHNLEPLAPRIKAILVKEEDCFEQSEQLLEKNDEEGGEEQLYINPRWLRPEEKNKEFQRRSQAITEDCNFYFQEWLKCVKTLEYRVRVFGD